MFAGCGCATIVAGAVALAAVLGGLGAASSGGDDRTSPPASGTVQEHLAVVASESAEYRRLASRLDGNPVEALVTRPARFAQLQAQASAGAMNEIQAARLADNARTFRTELQDLITAAEGRRANASGSLAEGLVDSAGNGFIDIRWDADTACGASDEPGHTTAGCTGADAVVVHILPDGRRLGGDQGTRLVVLHELAHLYQYADADAAPPGQESEALKLKDRGLFQSSGEVMADCYALTYLNAHTLTVGDAALGYGYVCNDTERQAIRDWAAKIHAPMAG